MGNGREEVVSPGLLDLRLTTSRIQTLSMDVNFMNVATVQLTH